MATYTAWMADSRFRAWLVMRRRQGKAAWARGKAGQSSSR